MKGRPKKIKPTSWKKEAWPSKLVKVVSGDNYLSGSLCSVFFLETLPIWGLGFIWLIRVLDDTVVPRSLSINLFWKTCRILKLIGTKKTMWLTTWLLFRPEEIANHKVADIIKFFPARRLLGERWAAGQDFCFKMCQISNLIALWSSRVPKYDCIYSWILSKCDLLLLFFKHT